ncbi:conserved hypothetical protein [Hyella patelloides LEGE 07179]|uniref:Uncharacterized protein n=1 Tax=Hyella patelloides LEGE 07179 TaxID=945734 RepID=A0A563VS14_9CYAN|nr:hypothetical protein [Hyella patelloides]VEP14201.1 conserved hypothetical protein [Hyella patelloides LEGE 07179]
MPKSKSKPCDFCSNSVDIRYRIQYDVSEEWKLVCRQCWDKVSPDNPCYRYGGTWKAKK